MIRTLWHNCRLWRIRTSGIILLGLLLVAAQCNSTPEPTPTPTVKVDPPEIIGFTLDPPGPLFPEARIGIQVDTNCHGHKINNYRWVVGAGEGIIISDNETTLITYQAPEAPGSYEVRVELEYESGPPVKGSTMVEVVPKPTLTPTDTPSPTLSPTFTPTLSPTATPMLPSPTPMLTATPTFPSLTPTLTPIPTPIPTKLPAPSPVSPLTEENAAIEQGAIIRFEWNWEGYRLGEGQLFSIKVVRDRDKADCAHIRVTDMFFETHMNCETTERYFWQVIVVRPILDEAGNQAGWNEISNPSEPQYFDYKKLAPGNGGNGGGCTSPPFC